MRCEDCKYFDFFDEGIGLCRRNAPRFNRSLVNGETDGNWPPEVYTDEWCGEYEKKIDLSEQWQGFFNSLSIRGRKCLKKTEIHSFADLIKATPKMLRYCKNTGESTVAEIEARLLTYGLNLATRREWAVSRMKELNHEILADAAVREALGIE